MCDECRGRMVEVKGLSEKLMGIARQGEDECETDECMVFYGIVLDMARKLRVETDKRLLKQAA
jgi:hypothetical protein